MENKLSESYKDKRRCLYCGEPIADQKHARQKFCPGQIWPSGSIKSCKDDYHSQKRKLASEPFKRIADFHKRTYFAIRELCRKTKGNVTLDDLKSSGIILNRAIEFNFDGQLLNAYFHNYLIKQISKTEYKISEHGRDI